MAGAEGFEPPKAVLETAGLPLAYAPVGTTTIVARLLLDFLMGPVLTAERAELLQLNALRRSLLILGVGVVLPLALRALEGDDFSCHYSKISETVPAPTVRPPSRIANRKPLSMAIGVINSTSNCTLSPGITISMPSGNCATPVTSVVRK